MSIAERYGKPVDVFNAFLKYANKRVIERELAELNKKVLERKTLIQKQEEQIRANEVILQNQQQRLEEIQQKQVFYAKAIGELENRLKENEKLARYFNIFNDPRDLPQEFVNDIMQIVLQKTLIWIEAHKDDIERSYSLKRDIKELLDNVREHLWLKSKTSTKG